MIPYAVGVDIACRMKLTVLDLPASALDDRLGAARAGAAATRRSSASGADAPPASRPRRARRTPLDRAPDHRGRCATRAAGQLGTSGSGNHFVEFGTLELARPDLGLAAGTYLALLSPLRLSRPRRDGSPTTTRKIARDLHPGLPAGAVPSRLARPRLRRRTGVLDGMNLMGDFAAASHEVIHARVSRRSAAAVLAGVENHHNFAWLEQHDGRRGRGPPQGGDPGRRGRARRDPRLDGHPGVTSCADAGARRASTRPRTAPGAS